MTTPQLDAWRGEFGQEYTDRNVADWSARLPGFREIFSGLTVASALEVGCNRGHNLVALTELFGESAEIVGVEPNPYARKLARELSSRHGVVGGNALDLPFKDAQFDLVFTAGVLIHISLADLPTALREIVRASRRFVLALEYFAEEETVIPYRGRNDLLWKRNFLQHYQTGFPELQLVRSGYFGPEQGFDRTHWWLLEKTRR